MRPAPENEPARGEQDVRALFRQRRPSTEVRRTGTARGADAAAASAAAPRSPRAPTDYVRIKADLQERVLDEIQERDLLGADEETVSRAVHDFVRQVLAQEDLAVNELERDRLADELVEEALGIGPLAPLMSDPAITDILVNGHDRVYIERFGRIEKTAVRFRDDEHVQRIIERLAVRVGRRIDQSSPMVDMRLPDGSRVNATLPPVSIDGPTISIRRFGKARLRGADLLRLGMLTGPIWEFLTLAVRSRANVLISGGTGAGKSTLLGALAEAIPEDERIVTIEDVAELVLDQEHVVRLETRPANIEGRGTITTRDLLVNALRMRPTRILVGEVRSGEALDMLQAMNTGHDGSLCTVHANSPRDAISRLETMVLMAGFELPSRAVREQITAALDLVIHVRRFEDGVRRLVAIAEVTGMEGSTPLLQDVFAFRTRGRAGRRVLGEFVPTGVVPRLVERLRGQGVDVDLSMFRPAEGRETEAHPGD